MKFLRLICSLLGHFPFSNMARCKVCDLSDEDRFNGKSN